MPPKIHELVSELKQAGFINRGGKGSHRNYRHQKGINITISGKDSDDARHYQIRGIRQAIAFEPL
jgi:predicted RNA binding protein YcfA (HicA-like mRNA interferase family)